MSETGCSKRIWAASGFGQSRACENAAKVQRKGKWFCGVHDPERLRAIADRNDARRRAEWEAREADQIEFWIKKLRDLGYTVMPPAAASRTHEEGNDAR